MFIYIIPFSILFLIEIFNDIYKKIYFYKCKKSKMFLLFGKYLIAGFLGCVGWMIADLIFG